eukprot:gnl/TRDRNA2_/TRDRNA2_125995_c0_seq1.p1 gnl/TRDRNA2_/TRDRNA2_125995_c0~~gnl/TRDRNA2_/TRDRNA2_125995_c0_seq1.p1  ORF type:complete len:134 (-),score=35.06 gnl/TRDRNA2_/TRDRNA2_125995_c0_seq1:42-443(-)
MLLTMRFAAGVVGVFFVLMSGGQCEPLKEENAKPFDEAADRAAHAWVVNQKHGIECLKQIIKLAQLMDESSKRDDMQMVIFTKKLAEKFYGEVKEGWEDTLTRSLESEYGVNSPPSICKLLLQYHEEDDDAEL